MISIATLSFDFALRVIVKESHLLQKAVFAVVYLLKKAVELTYFLIGLSVAKAFIMRKLWRFWIK